MLKTYTLKNGLKVATYEIPQMRSSFLSLVVKAGSIFDKKEINGAAHFMEHILVQGIPSFPTVEELSEFVERLAGSYNALTYQQMIKFIINAPAKSLEDILKIGSEVFFEPLFPEDSIERERNAVLEEIRQNQDSLMYKNYKFFKGIRFNKNHPLLLDNGGSIDGVNKIKREDLQDYWSQFFYLQNAYLVLVGGFKNDEAKKKIEEIFGRQKTKKTFPGFPNVTNKDLSNRQVAIRFDPELKTCYVDLTFPSCSNKAPLKERVAQSILSNILGGLRSSRLHKLLRQKRGLVYGIHFGVAIYPSFGYCVTSTQATVDNLNEVIDLTAKELKGFYLSGPTADELEFAKNYLINRSLMSFDNPQSVAAWIEDDLLWEERVYSPEDYVKIIESIGREDIMKFMQKYFEFDKLNLVIQGPVENSKANIKRFEDLIKEL